MVRPMHETAPNNDSIFYFCVMVHSEIKTRFLIVVFEPKPENGVTLASHNL